MLDPLHRHRDLRAVLDGLIDHAIALGEFLQQIELVLPRAGRDLEAQATASARPVSTLQVRPSFSIEPLAFSVITAAAGSAL